MKKQNSIILLIFSLSLYLGSALAQSPGKKVLDIPDFDVWKSIDHQSISADGRFVSWVQQTDLGDPELFLYDTQSGTTQSFERGDRPAFSPDSKSLVFTLKPAAENIHELKREKTPPSKLPGDTLVIYNISIASIQKYPDLKGVEVPDKWDNWLIARLAATGKKSFSLLIKPLNLDTAFQYEEVTGYSTATDAESLIFSVETKDKKQQSGVFHFDATEKTATPIHLEEGSFKQLATSKDGLKAAFLLDSDTTDAPISQFRLFFWQHTMTEARELPATASDFLPQGWILSEYGKVHFSANGQRLFFGAAPEPILQNPDLLDEEIVQVEVWHYNDARLYPQQKVQLSADKRQNYTCLYDIAGDKFMQLGSPELPDIRLGDDGNANFVLAYTDLPYLRETSWEGSPAKKDIFLIDLKTGAKIPLAEQMRGTPNFSPEAAYVYWYDVVQSGWYAYNIKDRKLHRITDDSISIFYDEQNDSPDYPYPYGIAGWTTSDDFIMIYDRYDIWLIDPDGDLKPNNLTNARAAKQVMRYIKTDPDQKSIEEVAPMVFHMFDETNKDEGYVGFNLHTGVKTVLQKGAYKLSRRPLKAKKAGSWVFTKENYQLFPDLYHSKDLRESKRISEANPQQSEYNWGSIELVSWTSLDGQVLKGLLVKPENFDPNKKYPMIVNFYERSTDGLHNHRPPQPNRSQITYAFYASKGYVVFNPDIPYKIGYPGESAYNAIVSGVTNLIDRGFIDRERVGIQGHSWGGYQIAYILTRTNLFRCAESGAPVVNMFSAYGGIRWGAGVSRMFQYEHTQSRIGGTPWDQTLRFLENSPLFTLDKITTPVLIMHNDEDAAVPWEQGIEFFTAMRRLDKKVWMLNYNGEPHWPVKRQNRVDFQHRMAQFFDYYLQDGPMAQWMDRGVPAIEKGIRQGFEYTKPDKH